MLHNAYASTKGGIQGLFPGYFALVMATGIISIAAHLLKMEPIDQLLLDLNIAAYLILWILLLTRLMFYSRNILVDLRDNLRAPGFFTLVAGTCVLGSQLVIIKANHLMAGILWGIGLVLWVLLIYTIFTSMMIKAGKPSLDNGINGSWLIAAVATQSVSVLGTLLAGSLGSYTDTILFFSLCLFLLGGMLYLLIISMLFYRLLFFRLEPEQLTPSYWISMGALAISTLAGDLLILNASAWSFLGDLLPFLKGLTITFWAVATWWIPLLVILGAWRHIYRRYPLRYDPQYWSLVFPLGMYTVSTYQLAKALVIPPLFYIPQYFIYIALAAWLLTLAGLIYTLAKTMFGQKTSQPASRA